MAANIEFDGVWKRFRRGAVHDSLRDLIPSLGRKLFGRPASTATSDREFWALRDLSFEVKAGEVLGIIGSNGAGKSTTLKILNRIMAPTKGRAIANGKIGALIEVSAGFHQDLTGRQNVFLQGAIVGMRKSEVLQKFDDIVDFAGIGEFIDTPVKRYSSGMNARLGFSIAAHLEPDILIIDKVLAVGDHAFQKRAFGRIKEMARGGAPVVLVSHQLDRIAELCTKAIYLHRGAVVCEGTPMYCINQYLHGDTTSARTIVDDMQPIKFGAFTTADGLTVYSGDPMHFAVEGFSELVSPIANWTPFFRVMSTQEGVAVSSVTGLDRDIPLPVGGDFRYALSMQMNLHPGTYLVETGVWDTSTSTEAVTGPRLQIEVLERNKFWGSVQLNAAWTLETAQ